jgi:hypothetical protein
MSTTIVTIPRIEFYWNEQDVFHLLNKEHYGIIRHIEIINAVEYDGFDYIPYKSAAVYYEWYNSHYTESIRRRLCQGKPVKIYYGYTNFIELKCHQNHAMRDTEIEHHIARERHEYERQQVREQEFQKREREQEERRRQLKLQVEKKREQQKQERDRLVREKKEREAELQRQREAELQRQREAEEQRKREAEEAERQRIFQEKKERRRQEKEKRKQARMEAQQFADPDYNDEQIPNIDYGPIDEFQFKRIPMAVKLNFHYNRQPPVTAF